MTVVRLMARLRLGALRRALRIVRGVRGPGQPEGDADGAEDACTGQAGLEELATGDGIHADNGAAVV